METIAKTMSTLAAGTLCLVAIKGSLSAKTLELGEFSLWGILPAAYFLLCVMAYFTHTNAIFFKFN